MFFKFLQFVLIAGFPWVTRRLEKSGSLPAWLSPIVMCYGLGILAGNLHILPLDKELSSQATQLTIILAIPLLLFSTNVIQQLRYAPKALLSFALCVVGGLISTALFALVFHNRLPDSWRLSGMLTGMYTGGTPNMQAIGLALGADQETIILVNAADIFWGGIYLIFLTSVGHSVFGTFLPDFEDPGVPEVANRPTTDADNRIPDTLRALGLTLAVVGVSLALSYLIFGHLDNSTFLILALTTFSLLASLHPTVKAWSGTFEAGEYFLLMFCVALGLLADFDNMITHGGPILLYSVCILTATILIHLLLCYLFRIDRDTMMITATAALYSPVFVGQIASAIGNRSLVFTGIAIGLLGFAIGNYLGIAVALFLKYTFF